MKNDELDAATVERCAQVAERWLESSWRDEVFAAKSIASTIRSLIAGDARTTHLQGEGEPVVKQVPSPAETVSEEASEPYGWFEPITPELGGSLVERFRKGAEKPFNWSEFAFPLFRLRRMR